MRRALVTGVSRGIGLEVARMLLEDGWHVVGAARGYWKGPVEHPEYEGVWVDVANFASFLPLLKRLDGQPLNALIHCAAIQGPVGPFFEQQRDWDTTIQTNLMGTVHVLRAAWDSLHRSDDARILLFSGGGAFGARPFYSAYASSKAAVVSLMETLADELRDTAITVNCVAPGLVPTTMHDPPLRDDGGAAMAEAVACVRHLLSPSARGLSGKTISAPFDDWRSLLGPASVARVNASAQGTRHRFPIAQVARNAVAV